jgi:uncharacterized membrane protein
VLTVTVAGSVFQAAGIPWTAALEYPELLTLGGFGVALLAPQLSAVRAEFGSVARLTGLAVAFTCLLALSSYGSMSLAPLSSRYAEAFYQAVMLVASVAVLAVAIWRRWNETTNLAAAVLTIFLFNRFVDWFWDVLPRYVFFLVLAGVAFAWFVALRRVRTRHIAE